MTARANQHSRATLAAVFAIALSFRLWMLHGYLPLNPWVAALTLADAEMGRNLLAGRGWIGNSEMLAKATRAQGDRPTMVDLEDLMPVDDSKPGAMVNVGTAHSPGYSVWFAISYALAGGHYRYVYSQRMQAVLDACACLLLFGIGRRLWSAAAGLIAAALYAVSPAHVFLANLTVAASTDSFWFIAVAYGAVHAWTTVSDGGKPWKGAAIVGAAAFCGACMNSTAVVLPAVVTVLSICLALFDRRAFRLALAFLCAQVVVLTLLLPWAARNYRLYGDFSPVRGTFWQLAWASFGELPNPWGLGYDDKYYWNWIEENCGGCNAGQQDRAVRDFLLFTVVPSPGFARHIRNLVELRLPQLLDVARLPEGQLNPADSVAARDRLGSVLDVLNSLVPYFVPFVVLGAVLVLANARSRTAAIIGAGPSLFLVAFSLLFLVQLRKTVPAYGFLLVLAGVGIAACGRAAAAFASHVIVRRAATVALVLVVCLQPRAFAAVIAGGEQHSVAVQPNGFVLAWGNDLYGQLGDGSLRGRYSAVDLTQARGVWDVVSIAAGAHFSCALRRDGTVWTWGDNLWGELGDGTLETRSSAVRVNGLSRVTAIAAGTVHGLALDANGVVWAWGNNVYGQLGVSGHEQLRPVRVNGLPPIAAIAAGGFHSVGVDRDGHVWTWGQNTRGQLGNGSRIGDRTPRMLPGLHGVSSVSAGQHHTLALLRNGDVIGWGANTFGQVGDPAHRSAVLEPHVVDQSLGFQAQSSIEASEGLPDVLMPTVVSDLHHVIQIAAGGDFSLALTDEHLVFAWGDNLYGEIGDGTWQRKTTPTRVGIQGTVTEIAAGEAHAIAVLADGTIWTWGFGHYGQLGITPVERRVSRPRQMESATLRPESDIDFTRGFLAMTASDVQWKDAITHVDGQRIEIRGTAQAPYSYASAFNARTAGPDTIHRLLVADGEIRRGGVTVGLQVNEHWVWQKSFESPGPFMIRYRPPADASYQIVIAHNLPTRDRRTDVEIRHVGWVETR